MEEPRRVSCLRVSHLQVHGATVPGLRSREPVERVTVHADAGCTATVQDHDTGVLRSVPVVIEELDLDVDHQWLLRVRTFTGRVYWVFQTDEQLVDMLCGALGQIDRDALLEQVGRNRRERMKKLKRQGIEPMAS